MKSFAFALIAIAAAFMFACNDSSTSSNPASGSLALTTFVELHADTNSAKMPVFFSLKTNSVVPAADSATNKWDIAFYSTSIYTNSGVRGPGKGGVVIMRNTTMDEIPEAPASAYKTEETYSPAAIPTGSDNGWYHYAGPPTHAITPIPGTVLIIRTADEKYAKLRILNYYKGNPAQDKIDTSSVSRYYTFEFKFQPDGSKNLK